MTRHFGAGLFLSQSEEQKKGEKKQDLDVASQSVNG